MVISNGYQRSLAIDQATKRCIGDFSAEVGLCQANSTNETYISFIIRNLLFSSRVLLTTYSLFQVQDQLYAVNEQNNVLKDDVQVMKKEQKKLVNKLPVKEYPKEGIGLEEYSWDDLFSDDSREKQYAMESDLSNKLSPYFGLPTTLIVLDIPTQTLNIALAGDLTSEDNRQQIKKNIQAFATEAEGVSNLTQITFQLNVRDGEKQKQDYSCTFSRENGEDKFLMIQED
ncbi:hypothetical protein [Enterococcus malodoratus]|uniref:hypothetical protein n=1 Tax=Enterococcus malodoratus TaxID=71451 RepID=UPI001E538B58|nr:hypothetical protein [Enterococcus malodoratus]